jgi:UDP-2,3-diacylglucosamine hydrolase
MKKIERIAVIAGSGKFPLFLLKAARSNKIDTITFAIIASADKAIEHISDKVYWVEIGQAGKLIDLLQKEGIEYAVMAGKINKTTIIRQAVMLDHEAKTIISSVKDKKDDTILSAIANRLKDFSIELVDSTLFLKNFMAEKGPLTKIKPTKAQQEDIVFGIVAAREIGRLDIGQSVIVKGKAVIAVEAIEGTDEAIIRAGKLTGKGSVIVKMAKPGQDMRFDVPVVGCETLQAIKRAGSSVLAIEAGKVLMLEKDLMIKKAQEMKLCILGV